MTSRLKAILGLVLLFAVGIATGIAIAPHLQKHDKVKPFPAAEWTENTVRDYQNRFHLSPEAEAKVREAVTVAAQEIVAWRGEAQNRIQSAIKKMNATILPSLDAASQQSLQRWLEEKRAAMKVE